MAKTQFTGELLHCGAVRYQLNGSGTYKSNLVTTQDEITTPLIDVTMSATTSRQPVTLANFQSQKFYLYGKTVKIREVISISRIIIYVRPVATGYPQ